MLNLMKGLCAVCVGACMCFETALTVFQKVSSYARREDFVSLSLFKIDKHSRHSVLLHAFSILKLVVHLLNVVIARSCVMSSKLFLAQKYKQRLARVLL